MNPIGMKLKRAGSLFLALALALTFLPISSFATGGTAEGTNIYAVHWKLDDSGDKNGNLDSNGLGAGVTLNPPFDFSTSMGTTGDDSIDLWPTSSTMITDSKNDGSEVPYVRDSTGTTWYLYEIDWADECDPYFTPTTGNILSSDAISSAAQAGSRDSYMYDPSGITGEPDSVFSSYFIWYSWTTTPPEAWEGSGELPRKYTVNYDINLPSGVTQLYRIMYDEQRDEDYLEIGDQGALNNVQTEVNGLTQDVYEGRNFYVAAGLDSRYRGFLAFSDPSGEDVSYYYLSFENEETEETKYPWKIGDDIYYEHGQTVRASSDLPDDENTITVKANWVEIDPLTAEELVAADDALTLDVFERGGYYKGESVAITNVVANDLLLQWTDTNENLESGAKSGMDLMLDEDSTISYLLTTRLNSNLTSLRDDTNYGKFARFTFTLNIDNQLKFANVDADGNASIVFSSAFLKCWFVKHMLHTMQKAF